MSDSVNDDENMDDWTYLGFLLVHEIRCSRATLELGQVIGKRRNRKLHKFLINKEIREY